MALPRWQVGADMLVIGATAVWLKSDPPVNREIEILCAEQGIIAASAR
ncbi:hypothetical protein PQQ96_08950 [Paraburkholderia sediminicola]